MTPEKETKKRIMEVAFDLFSSNGYDRVSMNDIVERSGISKGGIFHHFKSKYALGRDSMIWWAGTHMGPLFEEGTLDEMDGRQTLIHFIDFMMDLITNDSNFTKFFWSIFDEAIRKKEDNRVWIEFMNRYVLFIEKLYREMGVKDPHMKSMLFLSSIDGMALYYAMLKEMDLNIDLDRLREEFIRTYVTFEEDVGK